MGGLIGINSTWLRGKSNISVSEIDTILTAGIYLISEGGSTNGFGNQFLIVVSPNVGTSTIQFLLSYSGAYFKFRTKWHSNAWEKWRTFSLT